MMIIPLVMCLVHWFRSSIGFAPPLPLDVRGDAPWEQERCSNGEASCDGLCVAELWDGLKMVPLFAKIMNGAQNVCKNADITPLLDEGCQAHSQIISAIEYAGDTDDEGDVTDKVCAGLDAIFMIGTEGCRQMKTCVTEGDVSECIKGAGNILVESTQKFLAKTLQSTKDAVDFGLSNGGPITMLNGLFDMIECPLTMDHPIDTFIDAGLAIVDALEEIVHGAIKMAKVIEQDNCTWSVLIGLNLDLEFGWFKKSEQLGIYFTMENDKWAEIAACSDDFDLCYDRVSTMIKTAFGQQNDDIKAGFFSASSSAITSGGMGISGGKSVQFLMGDLNNWKGAGWSLGASIGAGALIGAQVDFGLIFGASEDFEVSRLIGISFDIEISFADATPFDANVGCGFAKAATSSLDTLNAGYAHGEDDRCKIEELDDVIKNPKAYFTGLLDTIHKEIKKEFTGFDALEREHERCMKAVDCLKDECKAAWDHVVEMPGEIIQECQFDNGWKRHCTRYGERCTGEEIQNEVCLRHEDVPEVCEVPNSCNIANTCEQPRGCDVAATCEIANECKVPAGCDIANACEIENCWECSGWECLWDWFFCSMETIQDAAVCGTTFVVDASVCGYEWTRDITMCGVHAVTDATICGTNFVVDATVCGVDVVTDVATCGTKLVTDAVVCGSHFVANSAMCGWKHVCTSFETSVRCTGDIINDVGDCLEWAGGEVADCAEGIVEVITKDDGGAFQNCAKGVDKCTNLISPITRWFRTERPTPNPTPRPTPMPSPRPTNVPTPSPSPRPTVDPTPAPSPAPSPSPSNVPSPAPSDIPTRVPTESTIESMLWEEYEALCAITAGSKSKCKALSCRYRKANKRRGAGCFAVSPKKTKCAKIQDRDVCLRLGCNFTESLDCLGKPVNLLGN